MKKLILALAMLTISPCNFYAMNNQVINPTGFVYAIPSFSYDITDQNSPFYDQNQVACKAQIKGAQAIITQYQALNDLYTAMQFHKIKNQSDFITQIIAVYDKVQQELSGIKIHDPLIQDQNILKYANMNQFIPLQNLPTYNLILLSQKYITLDHALSTEQKLILSSQINPLLRTQPLLWQDLSQYGPETLEDFSSFLPMVYDKIWNNYKFIIASRLQCTLHRAKTQQMSFTAQFHGINQMKATLDDQATACKNAFIIINSRTTQAVSTTNEIVDNESLQVKLVEVDTQTPIVLTNEPELLIENSKETLQPQSTETTSIIEQTIVMNTPIKVLALSKKQLTAQAAEKKAEQSRIDKERHRLALEENKLEESKKIIPVIVAVTKNNSSKITQKKSTKKKSEQMADKDFDAILNAAIAENSKILKTDTPAPEKLTHKKIDSDIYTTINSSEELTQQPVDLIKYLKFIDTRNAEFSRLEQAKEVQRKVNLKKICSTKALDRERIKDELAIALNKKFDPISQIEKDIISLLNDYTIILSVNNISLEDFMIMKDKIVAAEEELQHHGLCVKWYLKLYPNLYEKIKKAYLKFQGRIEPILEAQDIFIKNQIQREFRLTEELKHQMHQDLHDQSPLHRQETISRTLKQLHKNNGILDISCLQCIMKTHEELQQLGTLRHDDLQQAEQDIKFLYVLQTAPHDYDLIKPIVLNLLDKAGIIPPKNLIDEMITMTAAITCLSKQKNEIEQFLDEVDVMIFYSLQRDNELSNTTILTENQMADVTKIHIAVFRALVDIMEV